MPAGYSLPSLLATYFRETPKLDTARSERHDFRRLEQLGYTVTLPPKEAALFLRC
jgi:hypothetical protein